MGMLTASEKTAKMRSALQDMFARSDTTLVGKNVKVEYVNHGPAPAWSNDNKIVINLSWFSGLDAFDPDSIIKQTGLNYHEIAHLLYSPGTHSTFRKDIEPYFNTWNLIEDQRIEWLLIGKWLAVAPYLTTIFMHFIMGANASDLSRVYPLVSGRRHVPKSVRAMLRKAYARQQDLPAIDQVVEEYRRIVHPRDDARALELVKQLDRLLANLPNSVPQFGHDSADHASAAGVEPTASQSAVAADAEQAEQYEGDGELSAASGGDGDDGADFSDDQDAGSGGDGASSGAMTMKDVADIREAAEEAANAAKASEDVRADVAEKQEQLGQAQDKRGSKLRVAPFRLRRSTELMRSAVSRFADEIRLLDEEADPGWIPQESSGRVNLSRLMAPDDYVDINTLYDRWDEGVQDATQLEVVIAGDRSGSMALDKMPNMCQAIWIVKRAIEVACTDASVTVLGFETSSWTYYNKGEAADPLDYRLFDAAGGTTVNGVVTEARKILEDSKRKHRIFIVVSDGMWDDLMYAEKGICMMNGNGVVTAAVHIVPSGAAVAWDAPLRVKDTDGGALPTHCCQHAVLFTEPLDLVKLARSIVTDIVGRDT